MFASSRHLHLELLCTHGTPVKNLSYLPAFPIVVSFRGYDFQDYARDIIFSALEHPDRVRVIDINVPYSLFESFEELAMLMQESFPSLIHLRLEWERDLAFPALPDTFLAGSAPRLQTISLAGIPFPAAPTFLLLAHDLIEVDLHDIPSTGYIPPEVIVASLAALPRLKDLTFGFKWWAFYPDRIPLPVPPITRAVLPALTTFCFEGRLGYFEDLVAQIDAPQLGRLQIEYRGSRKDFQIPQLCKFIDRSEKLKISQIRRAILQLFHDGISLRLFHRGQSSFDISIHGDTMGQVVSQISATLSNVDALCIDHDYENVWRVGHGIRWLEIFCPFTAVKGLIVDDFLSSHISFALEMVTEERVAEVLPALELLCLKGDSVSLEAFLAARQNLGRPVTVIDGRTEFTEFLEILGG
jgi:hypothetical protein